MPSDLYITSGATISKGRVIKNGLTVFESRDTSISAFLTLVYRYCEINYPKFYKMDHLSKLGLLTAEILLKDSMEPGRYKPEEVGVILSNASSSLDADLRYFGSVKDIASPALFVYTLPNIVIGEICIKHKFKGEHAFFIFEAFDADFIQQYVCNLLHNDILQACICGWVEVIGEEYTAVLFLTEKKNNGPGNFSSAAIGDPVVFTIENINKIYYLQDG